MIEIYELCQKYTYYILAKEKCDKDFEILEDTNNLRSKILRKNIIIIILIV